MRRSYVASILAVAAMLACRAQNERPSAQSNATSEPNAKELRSDIVYDRSALTDVMGHQQLHPAQTIKVSAFDAHFAENYAKVFGGTAAEVELMVFAPSKNELSLVKQPLRRSRSPGEQLTDSDESYTPTDQDERVTGRLSALLQGTELPRNVNVPTGTFTINMRSSVALLRNKVFQDLISKLPSDLSPEDRAAAVKQAKVVATAAVSLNDLRTFLKVTGISRRGLMPTAADRAIAASAAMADAAAVADTDHAAGIVYRPGGFHAILAGEGAEFDRVNELMNSPGYRQWRSARRLARETTEEYFTRMEAEPGMAMAVAIQQQFNQFLGTLARATAAGAAFGGTVGASTAGISGVVPGALGGAVCGAGGYCLFASRDLIRAIWNQ